MAIEKSIYKKLPGRSRKHFGLFVRNRHRLWLGSDHILNLRVAGYSETSKRFYLKDIQALVITRTSTGKIANIVVGLLAATPALIAAILLVSFGDAATVSAVMLGILAALFALILLLNTAFGPTCICKLHTAVQVEDLTSLRRLRSARKTMDILTPFIEAAQGRLTPEELNAFSEEHEEVQASVHAQPVSIGVASQLGSVDNTTGTSNGSNAILDNYDQERVRKQYAMLFFLLLMLAVSCVIDVFHQTPIKNIFDMFLVFATMIINILVLIKSKQIYIHRSLKKLAGVSIGSLILIIVIANFVATIRAIIDNPSGGNPFVLMDSWQTPHYDPLSISFFIFQAVLFFVVSVMGFYMLRMDRHISIAQEESPRVDSVPEDQTDAT